jgi:PTH1 family peptidyl-tRNA hydrolase
MNHTVKLIAGLGNPGQQYAGTRHNAGAELVEKLAGENHSSLKMQPRFFGSYARLDIAGNSVHLLVPATYMNRSGQAVAALANFYKIDPENILVVHDELDLAPGVARFKHGGGHGGHNGLRDIIQALGNNNSFSRLRVGIGHPGSAREVTNYVLKVATAEQRELIHVSTAEAIAALPQAINGEWPRATMALHSANPA